MAAASDSREPTGAIISKSFIEAFIILLINICAKIGFFPYFCSLISPQITQIHTDYKLILK